MLSGKRVLNVLLLCVLLSFPSGTWAMEASSEGHQILQIQIEDTEETSFEDPVPVEKADPVQIAPTEKAVSAPPSQKTTKPASPKKAPNISREAVVPVSVESADEPATPTIVPTTELSSIDDEELSAPNEAEVQATESGSAMLEYENTDHSPVPAVLYERIEENMRTSAPASQNNDILMIVQYALIIGMSVCLTCYCVSHKRK